MDAAHLSRSTAANPSVHSPGHSAGYDVSSTLRDMVAKVAPLPHQQENIFAALEEHELLHEKTLRVALTPRSGVSIPWPAKLTDWLVAQNRIKAAASQIYCLFFMDLIALAQPPAPSSTDHRATAGSRKRGAEDISVTSEASVSPTSPSKSACSGKRFPSIEKLNTAHAKFWQYLPVAARLSVTLNREPKYTCACGKERGAAQAYNFGRHASKCAPGILPGDGAADWPAEKLPPSLPLQPPSAQERSELAKLPPAALFQIPHHWRALFSLEAEASVPAPAISSSAAPTASEYDHAEAPPVADPQIVQQLPEGSLIAAMVDPSVFLEDQPDYDVK